MSTSTDRVRSFRFRQRNGLSLYLLELDTVRLEVLLRESGFLTAIEPTNDDVTLGLQRMIEFLIEDCETRFHADR